jgi:hypothetical protein
MKRALDLNRRVVWRRTRRMTFWGMRVTTEQQALQEAFHFTVLEERS